MTDRSLDGTYAGTLADFEPESECLPTTHAAVLPLFSPAAQQPTKRYRTIVADPPWHYDNSWNSYRGVGQPRNTGAAGQYATMTVDEIANLPVGLWAQGNSHLYLWTTNAYIEQAHRIARAWGFNVKTILTWVKRRAKDDNWIGMGSYYRNVTEHVLFAVRGSLGVLHNDQATLFYGARGAHSEKPAAFYDMVQRMSPGPYLDVFARKQRMGWDSWGDEAYDFQTHGYWHDKVEQL